MAKFTRELTIGAWADDDAIRYLFSHWVLPGTASGQAGLRIGVRGGYLNLYVRGQSVARLVASRHGARIEVHPVYVAGLKKRGDRPADLPKRYRSFRTGEFTPADIDRWIDTAATYVGAEKAFVDDLIAANPNVIDLEMGLPAQTGSRSAPRMDLVVVQPDGSIAFWETKCSDNGELRSKVGTPYAECANGDYVSGIHVVNQLRNYQRWMEADGGKRQSEVVSGYVRTATILGELAQKFGKEDAAALEAWSNVSSTACLILPPGVVVGNYCPAGYPSEADNDTDRFERLARSYSGYRGELEAHGARVHEVSRTGDALLLPVLVGGHISDKPDRRSNWPPVS